MLAMPREIFWAVKTDLRWCKKVIDENVMSIFRASKTWIYFGRLNLEELFMPMDLLAVPLTTVFAEDVSI